MSTNVYLKLILVMFVFVGLRMEVPENTWL